MRGSPRTEPGVRMPSCERRNRLHEAHSPTLICIQKERCRTCGRRRLDYLGDCEIDHLEPHKMGGYDGLGNVYAAHGTCNGATGRGRRRRAAR